MKDSTPRFSRSRRAVLLTAIGTALYFATLALALYELDRQHYQGAKQELIRDNFYAIFHPPLDAGNTARQALVSEGFARKTHVAELQQQLRKVISGPTSIYSYVLKDPDGKMIMELSDPEKPKRMNTWRNCLFIRHFDGLQDNTLMLVDRSGPESMPQFGHLVAHYATPPDFQPIIHLTTVYRWYAWGLVSMWLVVYAFLYKYLLNPMQKVTAYLSRSLWESPQLIPRPAGLLQKSYNEMAAQALLQQLQEKLNAAAGPGMGERIRITEDALSFAAKAFSIDTILVAELARGAEGLSLVECFAVPPEVPASASEIVSHATAFEGAAGKDAPGEFRVAGFSFEYLDRIAHNALFIYGQLHPDLWDLRFRMDCVRQVCEAIHRAGLTYRAYQQDIVRQRSEANIVLSRNLGHDLTNIIATSKLELLAIKQLLREKREDLSGLKAELLRDSVQGLLENTKFLQEIVNIYRSFSHVKRPQYERLDLNLIVEEFLASFELSLSSRISLKRNLGANMPAPIIESRLLKLALFNVLTNAIDAMRRAPRSGEFSPEISITSSYDSVSGTYTIRVDDNGPGIRDSEGRLLDRGETDAIFQYGYSTKSESSEGLGLNWVRTIVEDFHAGQVRAHNRPEGGATFTMVLRSMEVAEAKVQENRKTGMASGT